MPACHCHCHGIGSVFIVLVGSLSHICIDCASASVMAVTCQATARCGTQCQWQVQGRRKKVAPKSVIKVACDAGSSFRSCTRREAQHGAHGPNRGTANVIKYGDTDASAQAALTPLQTCKVSADANDAVWGIAVRSRLHRFALHTVPRLHPPTHTYCANNEDSCVSLPGIGSKPTHFLAAMSLHTNIYSNESMWTCRKSIIVMLRASLCT